MSEVKRDSTFIVSIHEYDCLFSKIPNKIISFLQDTEIIVQQIKSLFIHHIGVEITNDTFRPQAVSQTIDTQLFNPEIGKYLAFYTHNPFFFILIERTTGYIYVTDQIVRISPKFNNLEEHEPMARFNEKFEQHDIKDIYINYDLLTESKKKFKVLPYTKLHVFADSVLKYLFDKNYRVTIVAIKQKETVVSDVFKHCFYHDAIGFNNTSELATFLTHRDGLALYFSRNTPVTKVVQGNMMESGALMEDIRELLQYLY